MNMLNTPTDPARATSRGHAINALLVDDDAFQRDMIVGILKSLGLSPIAQASSADQALRIMSGKHGFNLLLLDLHMPGMDGFQFMESLVKADYTGALIIVSGQSSDVIHAASMVAKLRRFNVLGTVPKPVERAALSALIDKMH
jgi:CheY-like chemotaxis protein